MMVKWSLPFTYRLIRAELSKLQTSLVNIILIEYCPFKFGIIT